MGHIISNARYRLSLDRTGVAFDFSNQQGSGKPRSASVMSNHDLSHSYATNFTNNGGSDYRHSSKPIISADGTTTSFTSGTHSTNMVTTNTSSAHLQSGGGAAPGTPRAVENIIVSTAYRRIVCKLVEKLPWLKLPDNDALYLDVRGLMHYVKQWHGGTFRRVVLSGLLDSTRNLVKTQYRVDLGYNTSGAQEGGQRG